MNLVQIKTVLFKWKVDEDIHTAAELTHVMVEVACPHELVGGDLVLAGDQPVHRRLVLEEYLHPDEWLAALLREHVPGLGPRQEVGHGALAQPQHRLAEQPLADAVLAEDLLDAAHHVVSVEVAVPDTAMLPGPGVAT